MGNVEDFFVATGDTRILCSPKLGIELSAQSFEHRNLFGRILGRIRSQSIRGENDLVSSAAQIGNGHGLGSDRALIIFCHDRW